MCWFKDNLEGEQQVIKGKKKKNQEIEVKSKIVKFVIYSKLATIHEIIKTSLKQDVRKVSLGFLSE